MAEFEKIVIGGQEVLPVANKLVDPYRNGREIGIDKTGIHINSTTGNIIIGNLNEGFALNISNDNDITFGTLGFHAGDSVLRVSNSECSINVIKNDGRSAGIANCYIRLEGGQLRLFDERDEFLGYIEFIGESCGCGC